MRKQNSRIMGFESVLKHLARLKINGRLGGCRLASEASKDAYTLKQAGTTSMKQGVVGVGPAPHLQTQCSHNGFRKNAYALKQAGTTSSLLLFLLFLSLFFRSCFLS